MTVSELIAKLQELRARVGGDPEVLGQSHGCCRHGHEIKGVEIGEMDESGCIVIRV